MLLEISKENEVTIVVIKQKRATMEDAKEFKEKILDLIETGKLTKMIIDFSEVNFADSTFMGALVASLKRITSNKGDIKVLGLSQPIRAMFELTRLYKIFEIFDNRQDAVNSF